MSERLTCKSWYDNGQLHDEYEVVNHHIIGDYRSFYKNGQPENISYYNENGFLHGKHTCYFENGNTCVLAYYVDGRLQGQYTSHYYNGNLCQFSYYEDGLLHGESIYYELEHTMPEHRFHVRGEDITETLSKDFNIDNLSGEEKAMIKLRWGIRCLK